MAGPTNLALLPDTLTSAQETLQGTLSAKKRALFIPASIRSHIIIMLYLANLLAAEYDIHYAVIDQMLVGILYENVCTPLMNDHFRIEVGIKESFLRAEKHKAGFWPVLRSVYTNKLYLHRKGTFDELITRLQPDVVIIDPFSSTDYLALYHYRSLVWLLFSNLMLSTYRVGNFPNVSEGEWPQAAYSTFQFARNPRSELY